MASRPTPPASLTGHDPSSSGSRADDPARFSSKTKDLNHHNLRETGRELHKSEAASTNSSPSAENPWPVRDVSTKIGGWIARLGEVWVEGQLAEVSARPGAHMVFATLRDVAQDVSMTLTCFRGVLQAAEVKEGSRVVVRARPTYYVARGTLSLRASEIRAVGIGELLARLEVLKKRLAAEGLFDPALKKKLPFLPSRVGLICGRGSAAERDVVQNAQRRWPAVEFEMRNVAVQGVSAVSEILKALSELENNPNVDVIIISRGGGSLEDLLPFSDEALCRAVVECKTPIVSAIGHEPDTPILDFVADLRCSTPTDAGKRVVPDVAEEAEKLRIARERISRGVWHLVERETQWLAGMRSRPVLATPEVMVTGRFEEIGTLLNRARTHVGHGLAAARGEIEQLRARVVSLSPAATLERGYAIVQKSDGCVVRRASDVEAGEQLRVRLSEGEVGVSVER